ncbi:histidine kinase [Flavobacteriaceae bacterium R38]|nr:histidine kinase [Flavobacteriaceae bacterium R38]
MENREALKYEKAKRRVNKIRRFYKHLTIYTIVNLFIVVVNISNLDQGESYFEIQNFFTLIFWGIGVLIHAFMVFGFPYLFGNDWEERKIQKYMENDQEGYKKVQRWE